MHKFVSNEDMNNEKKSRTSIDLSSKDRIASNPIDLLQNTTARLSNWARELTKFGPLGSISQSVEQRNGRLRDMFEQWQCRILQVNAQRKPNVLWGATWPLTDVLVVAFPAR